MAATPGSKSSTRRPGERARSAGEAGSAGPVPRLAKHVVIGRIAGAHGIRGWFRVVVFADGSEALKPGTVLYLEGESEAGFEVRHAAPGRRGGEWRVAVAGVENRDAAEALNGREVSATVEALGSADEDFVWGHELIGCAVESENGVPLGRVREIWETGGSDLLVVEAPSGAEHLLPAALLIDVDVGAQRAVVEVFPGLVDLEDGE